jgi:glucose/arabinose dehydrogenase
MFTFWSATQAVARESLKTERYTVNVETIASGLVSPWSVALLPDGLILITEKAGNLRVMRDGRLLANPVAGLPTALMFGQGGLLDVVAHPQYPDNKLIYWTYSAGTASAVGTEVARGRFDCRGDNCRVSDVEVIFRQQPKVSARQHFGSRLVWDREGRLFVTLGDRGQQDEAQNLGNHIGVVLRLTESGGIQPIIPSKIVQERSPKSLLTVIATCRAPRCIQSRVSYGRTSMGLREGMS